MPIKKPSFPRRKRRSLSANSCTARLKSRSPITRAFHLARTQHNAQPTTGRFSDLHPTFEAPSHPHATDSGLRLSDFRRELQVFHLKSPVHFTLQTSHLTLSYSERTLTAARPSRILTAFPFQYPRVRDLQSDDGLGKEHARTLRGRPGPVKQENERFCLFSQA